MPSEPRAFPDLTPETFGERLGAAMSGVKIESSVVDRLFAHYGTLRRWSPGVSLVGPGTASRVVERHYAESLGALSVLARVGSGVEPARRRLVDLGSGAGFPGWVLGAADPELDVVLVESRERKAAFLEAASRAARGSLSVSVLNARVAAVLPPGFPGGIDFVTIRALQLPEPALEAVAGQMNPDGVWLAWAGSDAPVAPAGFRPVAEVALAGSESRRLVALKRGAE